MCEDSSSNFWITTNNGMLGLFNRETGKFIKRYYQPGLVEAWDMMEDPRDADLLWFTTSNNGIYKFHKKTETFANYKSDDYGKPFSHLLGVFKDDQDVLWFTSESKFDAEIGKVLRVYGEGGRKFNFSPQSVLKTDEGEMWFSTNLGVIRFNPDKVKDNPYIPPVYLSSITQGGNEIVRMAPEKIDEIELPGPNNFFEFEYVALNYTRSNKNQYAYMLEGFDKGWYRAGEKRFGRYTGIPPGVYTLRIKGSNNDSVWNEDGVSIRVTVLPQLWQTWWFKGMTVLIVLGIVFGMIFWRFTLIKSQRRKLEIQVDERTKELSHAKEKAEVANKAKSQFLANMSHELRTPLNSILGFSRLMRNREDSPSEYEKTLDTIVKSGEHLLILINDVLTMSKIEAGRFTLNKSSFDLYHFLDNLEHMFGLKAEEKGLELLFKRSSDVPQFILTDEIKLRQVLINLIGNAIKFTLGGSVSLQTEIQHNGPEVHLEFIVRDTGPGIAPEDLVNIFDPFAQAEKTQSSQMGTGLGLSISRDFVDIMGGSLTGESSGVPGEGSVFTLSIKTEAGEQSEEMAESVEAKHSDPGYLHEGQSPEKPLKMKYGQTVRDLSALSPEWLNEFKNAIESIDMTAAVDLIKQINKKNKPLAENLMAHVEKYRFDVLQSLMKELE